MTTQIEVMYLNEPTVEVNVQKVDMDILLDKMDAVEQKEKVLEEGSDSEGSEVEDEDAAVVAVPKSQDIFVDRVGNKNKKQPSRKLEQKSKSFTLRATKRLFKSFSKRKSLSSASSSSSTKDDTLQAAAAVAVAVAASIFISTKPTFDSTNESEEEKEDLVVDINHDDDDDDDDGLDMTKMMKQEELAEYQTEEEEQQQQQETVADEVTDDVDAIFGIDDDDDDDDNDDDDEDEDDDHNKSEAEGVEEVQVQEVEVEAAADDAVMNEVTEPSASWAEVVSTPLMKLQGAKTDDATTHDDDDEEDEDEEQHKFGAAGAEERQELEATAADADAVINDAVLDPSSSSVEEVLTTPLLQEQEVEVEADVDDFFLHITSLYHPKYWKVEHTVVKEEAAEEVHQQQEEEEAIAIEATATDDTVMTKVIIDPSSSSVEVEVEVLLTPFVMKEQEEEESSSSSRTLLFVAMFMIIGIIINIYCNYSDYYDLFFTDQGQQVQEQEDGRIVQVIQAATNVIPKRNVVLVISKWVRTIITNKRN